VIGGGRPSDASWYNSAQCHLARGAIE